LVIFRSETQEGGNSSGRTITRFAERQSTDIPKDTLFLSWGPIGFVFGDNGREDMGSQLVGIRCVAPLIVEARSELGKLRCTSCPMLSPHPSPFLPKWLMFSGDEAMRSVLGACLAVSALLGALACTLRALWGKQQIRITGRDR
jgi:hypothetical protein